MSQHKEIKRVTTHVLQEMKNRGEEELLSVTVVKDHQLSNTQLIEKIEAELKTECNIENVTFF